MQRYEEFSEEIIASQNKRRYATLYYPVPEKRSSDVYIITNKMDRLDLLADKYYNDPRLWVIIAKANTLHAGTIRVPTGVRLRIPYPLSYTDIEEMFINKQF